MARSPHQENLLRLRANDSTLNTLLLNGNDSEGEEWGAAIENNTALTSLQTRRDLSAAEAEAFGPALKTNKALTTLHLRYNEIGDDGAAALATGRLCCNSIASETPCV